MIVIRREQMQGFHEAGERKFIDEAIRLMRELWPNKCASFSEMELIDLIQNRVAEAHLYGISDDQQIFRYLNILFMLGKEFPNEKDHPWAMEVLNSNDLSSEQKVGRLWSVILNNIPVAAERIGKASYA
jgi:hypothetical protein